MAEQPRNWPPASRTEQIEQVLTDLERLHALALERADLNRAEQLERIARSYREQRRHIDDDHA